MWQPSSIDYPDAEQVMVDLTRPFLPAGTYVGRKIPKKWTVAVIWNRIGGSQDPPFDTASMQCRVFAPTDQEATNIADRLKGRLPGVRNGAPVMNVVVVGGPTDLGTEDSPMRQLLIDVTMRGQQA